MGSPATRRQVLKLAGCSLCVGAAGCVETNDARPDDCDPSWDADPASWTREHGPVDEGRVLQGDSASIPDSLDERWAVDADDVQVDAAWGSVHLSTDDWVLCGFGDGDAGDPELAVLRTGNANVRWRSDQFDPDPPDGTREHDAWHPWGSAMVGDSLFVSVAFVASESSDVVGPPRLSGGVYEVDLFDPDSDVGGAHKKWSREGIGGLSPGPSGYLFEVGVTDALQRAAPGDREEADGAWEPGVGTDERLHVRARDPDSGRVCWEWDTSVDDRGRIAAPPTWVSEDRLVTAVLPLTGGADPDRPFASTDLYVLDPGRDSEEEPDPVEVAVDVPLLGRPTLLGDTLVAHTDRLPGADAPADDGLVVGVDLERGAVDWQTPVGTGTGEPPTGDGPAAVVGDGLYGVDPEDGTVVWRDETVDPDEIQLVCAVDGDLYLLDRSRAAVEQRRLDDGESLRQWPIESDGEVVEAIASHGRFYVGVRSDDGGRVVELS